MDVERFLRPISEATPTGVDLRLLDGDTTLLQLAELRREADADDHLGTPAKTADFQAISRVCSSALLDRSKDLELALHQAEAWARMHGPGGLAAGLQLIRGLVERFWEDLHPGKDPEETLIPLPARRKYIERLGGVGRNAARSLLQIPLLPVQDGVWLTWADHQEAEVVDQRALNAPEHHAELIAGGAMTGERWRTLLASARPTDLSEALSGVYLCQKELRELEHACTARFGEEEAPILDGLRDLLREVAEHLAAQLPGARAHSGEPSAPTQTPSTGISTRADALRRLTEIAAFFLETEPHSPISYLVQRAARWGDMPLEAVLREVVQDESVLSRIWDTLGIRQSNEQLS